MEPALTLRQLTEELAELRSACAQTITTADLENRKLTSDEAVMFGQNEARIAELKEEIHKREFVARENAEAAAKPIKAPAPDKPDGEVRSTTPEQRIRVPAQPRLSKTLKAFRGPNAYEDAVVSGRMLLATVFDHKPSMDWCQRNGYGTEVRSLSEGVNSKGGFLVPIQFEQAVINLREEYGVARQICHVYPMSGDHAVVPRRVSGLTAYAVGENTAITASDKSWNQVGLTAKKWGVLTQVSSELNEDTFVNITDDLASEIAWAFAKKEDESLIDGDGTSTYHGMTGFRTKMVDGAHAGSYYALTAIDQFSEITAAHLSGLIGMCPGYALAGARWLCSSVAWALTFERLLAAGGGNTIATLAAGAPKFYMGYPVTICQAMPAATTAYNGLIMLAFGNFEQAVTLGNRRGLEIAVSNEVYFAEDAIGIKGTTRFDINVHDIGDATTAGPVVGLQGNT